MGFLQLFTGSNRGAPVTTENPVPVSIVGGIVVDPPVGGALEDTQLLVKTAAETTAAAVGAKADASATTDTGTFSLIALVKRWLEKATLMVAGIGGVADAAWTSGSGSTIALLKAIATSTGALATDTSNIPVYAAGREYEPCPASATTTLGATGALGDDLDHIVIVPGTTSPSAVSIKDGSDTAIVVFTGGASSVSNLVPFAVPLNLKSRTGAWQIVTGGTNVTVLAAGNFT